MQSFNRRDRFNRRTNVRLNGAKREHTTARGTETQTSRSILAPAWLVHRMETSRKMPPPTLKQVDEQWKSAAEARNKLNMRQATRLFIFVDPNQPAGSYGQKIKMEISQWVDEGWRVKLLLPEHVKRGNKRFPKSGWLLVDGAPKRITRESCASLCSQTRK
jgi:hypothetical protein